MDFILNIDHKIFKFLNGLNTQWIDPIMWFLSGKFSWTPLYLFVLFLYIKQAKKQAWKWLILTILVITLCDQTSVHLFKNIFMRLRPCHDPLFQDTIHLVNNKCGGSYSFVSSHATNTFGLAVFSLLVISKKWFTWLIIIWASIVSYSRIYLGVHFPLDILCGGLLGSLLGWLVYSRFHSWVRIN